MYKTHFLKNKNEINEEAKVCMQKSVEEVQKQIYSELALEECDILIATNPKKVMKEEMVQGFPGDQGSMYLMVDDKALEKQMKKDPKEVIKNVKEHLCGGLYLTARAKHLGIEADCGLLEEIVGEGLAEHYAAQKTGREPKEQYRALTKKDIQRLWKQIKKEVMNPKIDVEKWFRGDKEENIPPHAALPLGFAATEIYFKKTGKNSLNSITISAKEIADSI